MSSLAVNKDEYGASSFLDYPEDILNNIFGFLAPSDLYAACLVNKTLRAVAEPLLYSEIEWTWRIDQAPPVIRLLQTILRRPQLALQIKRLTLAGDSYYYPVQRTSIPKIPASDAHVDALAAFVENSPVSYRRYWAQELRRGTMDAFVALLISRLPNLVCLSLGPNFARETELIGMVLRSALCEPGQSWLLGFPRLMDVSFKLVADPWAPKPKSNTQDTLALFYLPAVEHISATVDNPEIFAWPAPSPPSPSGLTSLELFSIREVHLGHVLSVANRLTSFRWEWSHYPNLKSSTNTPIIDLGKLNRELLHIQETLEDLTISARVTEKDGIFYPALTSTGSLAGLAAFKSLKRLDAPLVFLTGWKLDHSSRLEDVLPPNVEDLVISDCLWFHEDYEWDELDVLSLLQRWLPSWKTSTPHLRQLTLSLRRAGSEYSPSTLQALREACAGAGLPLVIID